MKKIFDKLYHSKHLTEKESYILFTYIINKKISKEKIISALIAMKMKKKYSSFELIGAIKAILKKKPKFILKPKYQFSDIVGTGGDQSNTINISTISALTASALGFKIAKHCNKSMSSSIGSADLLNYLGINIFSTPLESKKNLEKSNICFLFAPSYYPCFNYLSKIRKALKTRTIFNLIAPLLNPFSPPFLVIGVYSSKVMYPIALTAKKLGYQRVIIINSDHIDEVTLHAKTNVVELKNNKIFSYELTPKDFGMSFIKKKKIIEKNVKCNLTQSLMILKGKGEITQIQTIAANVSMILKVFGKENLKKNTEKVLNFLHTKKVINHISTFLKKDKR